MRHTRSTCSTSTRRSFSEVARACPPQALLEFADKGVPHSQPQLLEDGLGGAAEKDGQPIGLPAPTARQDHADRRCAQYGYKVARNAFLKGESWTPPPEIHAASDVYIDVYEITRIGGFRRKNQ